MSSMNRDRRVTMDGAHRCDECHGEIRRGEIYFSSLRFDRGDDKSREVCAPCMHWRA